MIRLSRRFISEAEADNLRAVIVDFPDKTYKEIAEASGMTAAQVGYIAQAFGIHRKRGRRRLNRPEDPKWLTVDWTKRDTDIAVEIGVTRERVRQIRVKLAMPKAELHGCRAIQVTARKWVVDNRELITGLALRDVLELCPLDVGITAIGNACRDMRVPLREFRPIHEWVTKENLRSLVTISDTDCWLWPVVNVMGRARIGSRSASHVIYELHNGPIPDGKWVLHTCDNGACVNPEHLYAGSAADNARDRKSRGRNNFRRIFSDSEVIEIRRKYSLGMTVSSIARELAKSYPCVLAIARGLSYRDVTEQVPDPIAADPANSAGAVGPVQAL